MILDQQLFLEREAVQSWGLLGRRWKGGRRWTWSSQVCLSSSWYWCGLRLLPLPLFPPHQLQSWLFVSPASIIRKNIFWGFGFEIFWRYFPNFPPQRRGPFLSSVLITFRIMICFPNFVWRSTRNRVPMFPLFPTIRAGCRRIWSVYLYRAVQKN